MQSLNQLIELITSYIAPQTILWTVLILVGGVVANKAASRFIKRTVKKQGGDEHVTKTARKLASFTIYSLTLIALLGVFNVPLGSLATLVGLLGLGLSFAMQDMIANFISGIMILISRPFKIGDQIEAGGEEGTVQDIRIRATDIKTYDGRKVIIPNSNLYNDIIVNNTAYGSRRFEVVVGIGYEDDIKTGKEIAEQALEDAEHVEDSPEPQVLVNELGGSSVNLKLRGWTDTRKANVVKASSELTQLIKDRYDEEGIDIPYPIRTIYMEE
jgi:small conductance mechanosensitive channel